jgi:hypothetical protein
MEQSSIFLLCDRIAGPREFRRLRRLPALGCRGPDDLTPAARELFCPGGLDGQTARGYFVLHELRIWYPERHSAPGEAPRLAGWHHLLAEGFRVVPFEVADATWEEHAKFDRRRA